MAKICKVLVVEDNSMIRELLTDVFEDHGYHFQMAADADEMRHMLAAVPDIDVVILDVTLPGGVDGMELAQEVADLGLGVVFATGDHSRIEKMEASGHRYILKPFKIANLLDVIAETLKATERHCVLDKKAASGGR